MWSEAGGSWTGLRACAAENREKLIVASTSPKRNVAVRFMWRHLFHSLVQLRVFGFCGDEDGDVRVCVFPKGQEILIRGVGFSGVALHGIGSADLEMRECADRVVHHDSAMVEDFLELGRGFAALMRGQIGFAAHINWTQRSNRNRRRISAVLAHTVRRFWSP